MKQVNLYTETIDKYLDGAMSSEEQHRFEQQMISNPALAAEVALQSDVRRGIVVSGYTSLKRTLQHANPHSHEVEVSSHDSSIISYKGWKMLAACLLMVCMAVYLLRTYYSSHAGLVADYYRPYPNVVNPISRDLEVIGEESLAQAMYAYEAGNFRKTILLLEQHAQPLPATYQFYLALSYYETDRLQASVSLLGQVIGQRDELFYEAALWYQALALIRKRQLAGARHNLKLLIRREGSYRQQATSLLEALS